MLNQLSRRSFSMLAGLAAGQCALARPGFAQAVGADLVDQVAAIEGRLGARLGAVLLDIQTGQRWAYRSDERFPMCSTFKLLACGAVLTRVDQGQESLTRRIRFTAGDLVTYSPVTKDRAGGDGMSLTEVCEAAMTQSDNTAGNLILDVLGGPAGVTRFARSIGDGVTRLDRTETSLNEATPGDPRDTTTPSAMAANLQALVAGNILSARSRGQLTAWLVSNKTGDAKLRAGLPRGWRVGDKTGGGDHGTMNDVAVVWPPGRQPLAASIYMTQTSASFDDRNAAIAEIGHAWAAVLGI